MGTTVTLTDISKAIIALEDEQLKLTQEIKQLQSKLNQTNTTINILLILAKGVHHG